MLQTKFKAFKILSLVLLACSLVMSFFYSYFSKDDIKKVAFKTPNVTRQLRFILPDADTYIVKIWGLKFPEKVYYNSYEISPFYTRQRGKLKEQYFRVSAPLVHKGQNILDIMSNSSYSVRVKNFVYTTNSGNFSVIFKSSNGAKFRIDKFFLHILPVYIILLLSCFVFYFIIGFIVKLSFGESMFLYIYSLLGYFLLLLILLLIFLFSPYRIVLSTAVLVCLAIVSMLITSILILLLKRPKIIQSNQLILHPFIIKLISSLESNPDKFFIGMGIFFLVLCMIFLIFDLQSVADYISYLAYFSLVIGLFKIFLNLLKQP